MKLKEDYGGIVEEEKLDLEIEVEEVAEFAFLTLFVDVLEHKGFEEIVVDYLGSLLFFFALLSQAELPMRSTTPCQKVAINRLYKYVIRPIECFDNLHRFWLFENRFFLNHLDLLRR